MVLDGRNRIVTINPVGQMIFGQAQEELIGHPATAVLNNGAAQLSRFIEADAVHDQVELGRGDDRRCYEVHVYPFYDRFNQITGRLLVLRDITEQKQAETAVLTQKQMF